MHWSLIPTSQLHQKNSLQLLSLELDHMPEPSNTWQGMYMRNS